MRDFINLKIDEYHHHNDKTPLVIIAGDLNVNSRPNMHIKKLRDEFEKMGRKILDWEEKIL